MTISWRERVQQDPNLGDIANWAALLPDQLPVRLQRQYVRNRSIVARVLNGEPITRVALEHGLTSGRVSQIMTRCLGGDRNSSPALANGLLPHLNVCKKTRVQPLPTLTNKIGAPVAFTQLLHQAPGLAESLDQMLLARLTDSPAAQTLSVKSFHGEFKRFLAAIHWPKNQYPYCTARCAYESVRLYFHKRVEALKTKLEISRERDFREKRSPTQWYAGRRIQIDEQIVDLKTSLGITINGTTLPIALPRVSVLVATDVDTECILAMTVALTQHPTEEDMLDLLQACVTPRPLPVLTTPGLAYTPGSNFPCNIDGLLFTFSTVQLDNAWMHHSKAITDWICRKMGATVHYGLPAQPKARAEVERIFNHINLHVTHRPASTTGSHPADPIKASAKQARKLPLTTLQELTELLLVTLTDRNVTPRTSLAGMTPLNCVIEHSRQQCGFSLPEVDRLNLSTNMNRSTVAVQRASSQNVPYINFCYAKYYGECLRSSKIVDEEVVIEYDRNDIRFLKAYLPNGQFIGELQVSKSWLRYPHSLKLRKKIHKEVGVKKIRSVDKLAEYFHLKLKDQKRAISMLDVAKAHQAFTNGKFSPLDLDRKTSINMQHPSDGAAPVERGTLGEKHAKIKFRWSTQGASHLGDKDDNHEE